MIPLSNIGQHLFAISAGAILSIGAVFTCDVSIHRCVASLDGARLAFAYSKTLALVLSVCVRVSFTLCALTVLSGAWFFGDDFPRCTIRQHLTIISVDELVGGALERIFFALFRALRTSHAGDTLGVGVLRVTIAAVAVAPTARKACQCNQNAARSCPMLHTYS